LVIALIGLLAAPTRAGGDLLRGEEVIIFPSVATWSPRDKAWTADIEGWIYDPEHDSRRRAMLLKLLEKKLGLGADDSRKPSFRQRARQFLVDEKSRSIRLQVGDVELPPVLSDSTGHFQARVKLPNLSPNVWVPVISLPSAKNPTSYKSQLRTATGLGLGVISDIDDTMKITGVGNRRSLLANTFLKPFATVPGMSLLFRRWAEQDPNTVFFYVSASPWQLYKDLADFFGAQGFPMGLFSLKRFRWKDRSFFDLFQAPETYKVPVIESILQRFPGREFILVGDVTERDPEIYAKLARQNPQQIKHIYIRRPADYSAPQRFEVAFKDLEPSRWTIFSDPSEIP
jgi:phosphatidate phosphatase APP1